MVKDKQVRLFMKLIKTEKTQAAAAAKAGMDPKTARRYLKLNKLPSQVAPIHNWRTKPDPFVDDWPWVEEQLKENAGLEAKTLFKALQRMYPGKYQDGQLRTLQRRVKLWRATCGPAKEVFFPQIYKPAEWCESDFTRMKSLGVTIGGQLFDHMLYHFVLPYSNWETATICFSESYESLSKGLQNALWELGGVPRYHKTDQLTSAVNKVGNPQEFTASYQALATHYGFESRKTQAASPHENGDVEQSHHRLKRLVEQSLMLRGSKDFASINDYEHFLRRMFAQLNAGRSERFKEELQSLRQLPLSRMEDFRRLKCRVSQAAMIRVLHNSYSVHSRLVKEQIDVRIYADYLEVWYAQRVVETLPRLRGENKHRVDYRHIIDQLVRKPGAFENYRYKDQLFPTSQFRIAHDLLRSQHGHKQGIKEYLKILELAAKENQQAVNESLRVCIARQAIISSDYVKELVKSDQGPPPITDVCVEQVDIAVYDELLQARGTLV
jgi:hypothetical protein